jgi:hypothetical protein
MGVLRRYIKNQGKEQWEAIKWILKHLGGTATHAVCFGGSDIIL